MKTALVLFVKDEAHDIMTWLAWYRTLGFDTFIVYDDNSVDGTTFILEAAARLLDIRIHHQLFEKESYFYFRQEAFYKYCLYKYREEFTWLAFFDSDEYLSLESDKTIQEFLGKYEHADAVAINWAAYGSNGHVLSPRIPSVAAFTKHAASTSGVCKHVKCIVRPDKVGSSWLNVHAFDVEVCVNTDGEEFHWGHIPGVTRSSPTWRHAKLMHLQCRSMEQFVDRCKRRLDLEPSFNLWNVQDQNDLSDLEPISRLPDIMSIQRDILRDSMTRSIVSCSDGSGDWVGCRLLSCHRTRLYVSNGQIISSATPKPNEVLAAFSATEKKCILLTEEKSDTDNLSFVLGCFSAASPVDMTLWLQDPETLCHATVLPLEHGGHFAFDRAVAGAWETFSSEPLTGPAGDNLILLLTKFNASSGISLLKDLLDLQSGGLFEKNLFEAALKITDQNDIARWAALSNRSGSKTVG